MMLRERLWFVGKNKHFQLNLIEGAQCSVLGLVKHELKTGFQTRFLFPTFLPHIKRFVL